MLIHYDLLPEVSGNGQEEVMQNILEGSGFGRWLFSSRMVPMICKHFALGCLGNKVPECTSCYFWLHTHLFYSSIWHSSLPLHRVLDHPP